MASTERLQTSGDLNALIRLKALGADEGRALLRHQAAEENRDLSENWELVQIFLGVFFFAFLLLASTEGKISLGLSLLMVLLVMAQRFWLTPELVALGRPLDFAPGGGAAGAHARFALVHGIYLGMEMLKWTAGLVLGAMLVVQKTRRGSGKVRQQLNLVNKPDHGHIDR